MTRHARILVPGDTSAVAFARDRVLAHVRAWGVPLDEEKREAVKLVASELITNAVVHGGGFATVGLYLNDDRLLLVVHDGNPAEPRCQYATGDEETGRGLALVNFLAARNGWQSTARGKKVWAEFEVPLASPAARGEMLRRRMKAAAPRAYVKLNAPLVGPSPVSLPPCSHGLLASAAALGVAAFAGSGERAPNPGDQVPA